LDHGSGSILSGLIASGQIGNNHLASGSAIGNLISGAVTSGFIASGSINLYMISNGGIGSGNISSGNICTYHIASGQVQSGNISSGCIIGQLGSGARCIASGTIASFDLGNNVILSGNLGSGQVSPSHIASGIFFSFLTPCVEMISGFRAVCMTSGNTIANANAASGLRLPSIGICTSNYISGSVCQVITFGVITVTSGMDLLWSGQAGRQLFAGSGGIICVQGSLTSGMGWNRIGIAVSGGISVMLSPEVTSGGLGASMAGGGVF